ncbi:hypothetical protein AB9M62_01715 [Bacillales bacterium AN1005]
MKKVAIGVLAASLIFSQGLQTEAKTKKSTVVDKDKNGISDDWQKKYKLGNGKLVAQKDPDKDGLSSLLEYQLNSNPIKKDSDGDKVSDSNEDKDKDGIINGLEVKWKLNPLKSDTDGDGISDSQEDQDADNLTNKEEIYVGTSLTSADTDKDGLNDGDEDKDKDKLTNSVEFDLGYDPKDKDSDDDGIKDADEDFDKDGIKNSNEVDKLKVVLINDNGKEFKVQYKLGKKANLKVKDNIGIPNANTFFLQFTNGLTSTTTEEDLLNKVKQITGLDTFVEITVEAEFANGKELEFKYENTADNTNSVDDKDSSIDDEQEIED